jgi:multidrug efflux pump subunit AcrA (membrane-fusion protein)
VLVLVVAGYFIISNALNGGPAAPTIRYSPLAKGELLSSISVKGNVQSVTKRNVYSTLGFTIKSIDVSVGDTVEAGQVLCRLDTGDLELNIAQQRVELEIARESGESQIESNLRIYDEAAANLQSGSNAQIVNAEASLRSASVNLETAQTNYNNLLRDSEEGTNASVKSAESAVVTAKSDLDARTRDFETNRQLFAVGAIALDTLTQSETALSNAQNRYNDAQTSLESAKTAEARAIEQARGSLKSAQTGYDSAQASLSAARKAAEQELERYETNVSSSKISANLDSRLIAIEKLEKQLAEAEVRSPVAGVVTASYAKEGGTGSGLLFVIEDTGDLMIKTKVKEYDTGRLLPGMPVVIRSDALSGDISYEGALTKIDPAAVKNATGETDTASDIEFGAEIAVNAPDTLLRIGMNTRLDIVVDRRDDVFYVPFDSITTNAAGESVVYIVTNETGLRAEAKEVAVEIGLETDFYVEISGSGLAEGIKVVNDATGGMLYDGAPVTLVQGAGGAAGAGAATTEAQANGMAGMRAARRG